MTRILGISAFYHDSAAALVDDGDIVAAAQEERFTRKKHDPDFPERAIAYCLDEAGITAADLDYICFYEKTLKKLDRLLETWLAFAPRGFSVFRRAMPLWARDKLYLGRIIRKGVGPGFRGKLVHVDHHESHAASAFFPSPFDEAAILTSDGVGEWDTSSWGFGRGNRVELRAAHRFPHSLGLLYSAFTYFCGFRVNSGEYKLMGLAPFGEPRYADVIREELVDIKADGSFRLNLDYFTYPYGLTMVGERFAKLFDGPPRKAESELTQREMDLAASIQAVTEDVMLATARHVHAETGAEKLVMAGGVALNCVANGRVLREGPFEDVWIQPAAGDAGGALGAALFVWHQLLERPRKTNGKDVQKGSFLGPAYTNAQCRALLDEQGAKYRDFSADGGEEALIGAVVRLLLDGKVVGWLSGRMEFGPRALTHRSIIGDARNTKMQTTLNLKIKFRESFRPFAPIVLRERVHDYFEMREEEDSPYMLLVAPVREELRVTLTDEQKTKMTEGDPHRRVTVPRSSVPAITHVDYSARIQTVDAERHGRFYRLMKAFEAETGCGVLVNTSFNVRGEPIVNTPAEAFDCFVHTAMDALVMEDCLALKAEQPAELRKVDSEAWISRFELD